MRGMMMVVAAAVLCGCQAESASPGLTSTAAPEAIALAERRYELTRLPSLGGTDSRAMAINNVGWAAGVSHTADGARRAVVWRNGSVESLGTLGGLSSAVARPGLNNNGVIVGITHTDALDPLHEAWSCDGTAALLPTDPRQVCAGFWWEQGVMHALPTLGGTHAFANSVNSLGQIVGWAETAVQDPTCTGVQVLQFRAVLWEPARGRVRELPPFPGDSASAATGINAGGQVVGISGDCDQAIGRLSARRSVLWENGTVREIPNLGGAAWHTPWSINERGDVVGFSNLPGAADPREFNSHAFLWRYGSPMVLDLGTLGNDPFSQATGINARGQVIGVSHGGPDGLRAFLWEDSVMVNLNDLVELGADEVFEFAHDINDAGQIAGRIRDRVTGARVAVVATPVRVTPPGGGG